MSRTKQQFFARGKGNWGATPLGPRTSCPLLEMAMFYRDVMGRSKGCGSS